MVNPKEKPKPEGHAQVMAAHDRLWPSALEDLGHSRVEVVPAERTILNSNIEILTIPQPLGFSEAYACIL